MLLTGCGVDFVDLHPPQLTREVRTVTAGIVSEPVVFDIILDLDLGDPSACASASANLEQAARTAFLARDSQAFELPEQILSPGCQQAEDRTFDADPVFEAIESLATPPGAAIRPVFVYFNNIDLPLPAALAGAFSELQQRTLDFKPSQGPPIWAVASPSVTSSFEFDESLVWTYSGDPALTDRLVQVATADLPFISRKLHSLDAIPLFPGTTGDALAFKVCSSTDVRAAFALDGSAVTLAPGNPPVFFVATPDVFAVLPWQYTDETLSLSTEVCSGHCDQYAIDAARGSGGLWSSTAGCFLRNPS